MFEVGDIALIDRIAGTTARIEAVDGHRVKPEGMEWVNEVLISRARPETKPFKRGPSRPHLDPQIKYELEDAVNAMTPDWNGHYLRGSRWDSKGWYQPEKDRRENLFGGIGSDYGGNVAVSDDDALAILAAHKAGVALDKFIPVLSGKKQLLCPFCPGDGRHFETNGLVIRPITTCPYADGLVTEWDMDFPSGKIIVDDDLRYLCLIAGYERDVNTIWGTHLSILDYAECGLTVGLGIGNSSPNVYRMAAGNYAIGKRMKRVWQVPKVEGEPPPQNLLLDDEEDPDDDFWWVDVQPADRTGKYDASGDDWIEDLPKGCTQVASVCTDLRAYSIIDLDEAKRRAAYYGVDLDEATSNWSVHIIDIEPGKYRFRHFHAANSDDTNVTNATFERICDSKGCEDWIARDKAFDVDVTQAVQHQMVRRPNLYGACAWYSACVRVLFSEFRSCVPDRDWHRNGFRNAYLQSDTEQIPIKVLPRFRSKEWWELGDDTILSMGCTGKKNSMFGGKVTFNRSYAIAAGHILESVISFGLTTHHDTDNDTFDVEAKREDMRKAGTLWKALIKRYPHVAEALPTFAKWMENKEAVTRWIQHFDLGPQVYDRAKADRKSKESMAEFRRTYNEKLMVKPGCQVKVIGIDPNWSYARNGHPVIGSIGQVVKGHGNAPAGHVLVEFKGKPYARKERGVLHITEGEAYTGLHEDDNSLMFFIPLACVDLGPRAEKRKADARAQVMAGAAKIRERHMQRMMRM